MLRGKSVRSWCDGRRIDPSWGQPIELFLVPANCSTTGVTKAVVCAILSVDSFI